MNDERKESLWAHYSSIYRNILIRVLEWPADRAERVIEELRQEMLRQEMDIQKRDSGMPGYFYDPPSKDIWVYIVGDLYDKTEGKEIGAFEVYQRLENAISGGLNHWELAKDGFDWDQARIRYKEEKRNIEQWLADLGTGSALP